MDVEAMGLAGHQCSDPVALLDSEAGLSLEDFLHWLHFDVMGQVAGFAEMSVYAGCSPSDPCCLVFLDLSQVLGEPSFQRLGCHSNILNSTFSAGYNIDDMGGQTGEGAVCA